MLTFKPDEIGSSPRSYDEFTEKEKKQADENDKKEANEFIENVLPWVHERIPNQKKKNKSEADFDYKEHIEKLLSHERIKQIGAVTALKDASQKGFVLDRLMDVLTDLYYAARDILSGQKVKTSLTIGAGIGVGAAVGAVLGTLVFPGIGTAVGGTVGAGISAGLGAIGGTLGLSILGAFAGSWLGKKLSAKMYKHEKRFELSKRETSQIRAATGIPGKKGSGINSETARLMNGYLYNRTKAIQSSAAKQFYKRLRKEGIFNANPAVLEEAARFFCQELKLLEKEMQLEGADQEALQRDIDVVLNILKKLKNVQGFSKETHNRIVKTLKATTLKESEPKPAKKKSGLEYQEERAVTEQEMQAIDERFAENLVDVDCKVVEKKIVEAKDKETKKGSLRYRYQIQIGENDKELKEVIFKEKKTNDQSYSGAVFVRHNDLEKAQPEEKKIISDVLVAQAKAYHENVGVKDVVVMAAGDDTLAISLMVAAKRGGLEPRLDPKEYPENDDKMQERKKMILKAVEEILGSKKEKLSKVKLKPTHL